MKIVQATKRFEAWLGKKIELVPEDLEYKHLQMKADPFLFFRATYYRWCQLWPEECGNLACSAHTNVVGDLHLENFGTWRDTEGRLIWGVNDFDEAYPMAFTNDLVRLTTSVFLAAQANAAFAMKKEEICKEILTGYEDYLKKGGEPFVLMEKHPLLREMALQDLRQPAQFWKRLEAKSEVIPKKSVPACARDAIQSIAPKTDYQFRLIRTPKGLGSLGRQRFLAMGEWEGGMFARETKTAAPSALLWAEGRKTRGGNPCLNKIVQAAVRCQDPFYKTRKGWLVRRLGPDCSRIDIAELSHHHDRALLLRCMGSETANIHLGGKKAQGCILKDLRKLPHGWLIHAADKMLHRFEGDWKKFGKDK
jgi:hypothetical protein